MDAGCDDLVDCASNACCPIPFATITRLTLTAPPPGRLAVAGPRNDRTGSAGLFACCALPLLLAAGVLSGIGWAVTGQWMPAIAAWLIAAAAILWWSAHRHARGCSGGAGCSCRS